VKIRDIEVGGGKTLDSFYNEFEEVRKQIEEMVTYLKGNTYYAKVREDINDVISQLENLEGTVASINTEYLEAIEKTE
jgi:hypothetical protein